MKDRKSTEEQILAALERLIRKKGFTSLGINSIAKEANVSKMLIYRYFEGYEGMLETWAINNSFWTDGSVELDSDKKASGNAETVLGAYADSLRKDQVKREMLRWFLTEKTKVGSKVMAKLEESGVKATEDFKKNLGDDKGLDIDALISILTAGISYLALLADRADLYNGVSINSEEGWDRLEKTIIEVLKRLLD